MGRRGMDSFDLRHTADCCEYDNKPSDYTACGERLNYQKLFHTRKGSCFTKAVS
jgi:hypothetical protein